MATESKTLSIVDAQGNTVKVLTNGARSLTGVSKRIKASLLELHGASIQKHSDNPERIARDLAKPLAQFMTLRRAAGDYYDDEGRTDAGSPQWRAVQNVKMYAERMVTDLTGYKVRMSRPRGGRDSFEAYTFELELVEAKADSDETAKGKSSTKSKVLPPAQKNSPKTGPDALNSDGVSAKQAMNIVDAWLQDSSVNEVLARLITIQGVSLDDIAIAVEMKRAKVAA